MVRLTDDQGASIIDIASNIVDASSRKPELGLGLNSREDVYCTETSVRCRISNARDDEIALAKNGRVSSIGKDSVRDDGCQLHADLKDRVDVQLL